MILSCIWATRHEHFGFFLFTIHTGTSWNMVCCSCYFCSWNFYIFCSVMNKGKVINTTYNVYIPKEFLHSLSRVETSIITLVESNIWHVIKIYRVLKFTASCHAIFLFWHSWDGIVNEKVSAWALEMRSNFSVTNLAVWVLSFAFIKVCYFRYCLWFSDIDPALSLLLRQAM